LSATALAIPLIAVRPEMAQARTPFRGVDVRPRANWAGGLTPTGPLRQERPGDTRFLLVHHTASANDYDPGDVPGLLRGFYRFHTGPDRRWPDVAYNFFVDRYGTVWEGRTGSLTGPVMVDATGGSQGFAQLCCFIGDHQVEAPTPAAQLSMTALLAALADTCHRHRAGGHDDLRVPRVQPLAGRYHGDDHDDRRTSRHVPHRLPW